MIWKWIVGPAILAGIGYLLFTYVPGFKFWEKQRAQENTARDSLQRVTMANAKLAKDFADFKAQIEQDKKSSDDRSASVLPNIKVDVAGLTALAQRTANLENLIRSNLLTPADTAKATPVVSYNEPANQAITIKLRLFDSLQTKQIYTERAWSSLNQAYRIRGDTMGKARAWANEGKAIAKKKGLFTGRNKELREHSLHPPF
ncbi:hypothetical protein GO755_34945 [Spirosoma sp. HMF4905]|uniref:Uncharacterized protein n=1 Tax=Spirosoma arboris TaxID=2682092 RepID=A0A7K1SN96_9BACT|nr:hypothetical protein [Spirosoma arboris]MVM35272.1 hypothetical protein [Spirosoma arboris]